jgi:hypothetical protein
MGTAESATSQPKIRSDTGTIPNALAVSGMVRDRLAAFREIEFLPVNIKGHGTFYILHFLATEEVPSNSSVRQAPPPSGNIVEIHALPNSFEPTSSLFRLKQPKESAAGRAGSLVRGMFGNANGAKVILSAGEGCLAIEEVEYT